MAEEFMSQVISPLAREDMPYVHAIENRVYEDPWTERLLTESLEAPMTFTLGLRLNGLLIGYSIFQVIFTEGHLLNLAVDPNFQRRAFGQSLLEASMGEALIRGAGSFFLEVRPSNSAAIKLYEKKGFRKLMSREKYYSNGESALIMVADLSSEGV